VAETVGWLVAGTIKEGRLDAFAELKDEMIEGTSTEPGTLNYEWYIGEDDSTFTIWEKYADSEATMTHFTGFVEKWAGRFAECCEPKRFIVYGSPNDAVRAAIADWRPVYEKHWGGFAR
jgi:quinol monooxygenase YgiN